MAYFKILKRVAMISEVETALTVFNAERALKPGQKRVTVKHEYGCELLIEPSGPSAYYNRVKGFGDQTIENLDKLLALYKHPPCFDLTPENITLATMTALSTHGYLPELQLVNLDTLPYDVKTSCPFRIATVDEKNSRDYVELILQSYAHHPLPEKLKEEKKHYFYKPNFMNFMVYDQEKVAGMGSLFIHENQGYIANDFTFEEHRGKGIQHALILHRIKLAYDLGLTRVYTDVEFGTSSHNNMVKAGFSEIYTNTFFVKQTSS